MYYEQECREWFYTILIDTGENSKGSERSSDSPAITQLVKARAGSLALSTTLLHWAQILAGK